MSCIILDDLQKSSEEVNAVPATMTTSQLTNQHPNDEFKLKLQKSDKIIQLALESHSTNKNDPIVLNENQITSVPCSNSNESFELSKKDCDDKPYKCLICGKLFSRNSSLKCHIRLHEEDTAISTQYSSLSVEKNSIEHDMVDEESSYSCLFCDKCFSQKDEFKCHIQFHVKTFQSEPFAGLQTNTIEDESSHSSDEGDIYLNDKKLFSCVICDKRFPLKSCLILHYKNHPIQRSQNYEKNVRDVIEDSDKWKIPSHKLPMNLDKEGTPNLDDVHSEIASHSHNSPKPSEFNENDEKQYKCYLCSKSFARNSSLMWHIQSHEMNMYPKGKKSDSICEDIVVEKSVEECNQTDLEVEGEFKCKLCGRSYNYYSSLIRHLRNAHPSDDVLLLRNSGPDENGLFSCEVCAKTFETSRAKNIHVTHAHKHTLNEEESKTSITNETLPNEEGLYECNLCDRTFDRKKGLFRHMGYHNSCRDQLPKDDDTGSDIDLSLADEDAVDEVELSECKYCNREFKTVKAMKIHSAHAHREEGLEEDTDEEISYENSEVEEECGYMCSTCKRVFHSERARSIHIVHAHKLKDKIVDETHLDEATSKEEVNDHKCTFCSRTFQTSRALVIHIVAKHDSRKSFCCKVCERKFEQKESYNDHMKGICGTAVLLNNSYVYACRKCPRKFSHPKSMSRHLREHRLNDQKQLEQVTGTLQVSLDENDVDKDEVAETISEPESFKCVHCDKFYNSVRGLAGHMKIHKVDGEAKIDNEPTDEGDELKCPYCDKCYPHSKALAGHLKVHKSRDEVATPTKSNIDVTNKEEQLKCEFCSRLFSNVKGLAGHLKIHYRGGDDVTTVPRTSSINHASKHLNARTNVDSENIDTISCKYCDRTFTSNAGYAGHMKVHKGQTPVDVSVSPRRSEPEGERIRENKRTFACRYCEMKFNYRFQLYEHLQTHTSDRAKEHSKSYNSVYVNIKDGDLKQNDSNFFLCDTCDATFDCKEDLSDHVRNHCDMLSHNKGRMRQNLVGSRKRSFHFENSNPFKCENCEQTFLLQCHLEQHMKLRCDAIEDIGNEWMNDGFYDSRYLKRARKSYSRERFECDECDKVYANERDLQRHYASHRNKQTGTRITFNFCGKNSISGEKESSVEAEFCNRPYECVYCEKNFSKKNSLLDHIRSHAESNDIDEEDFETYVNLHAGEHFVIENKKGDEEHFIFEEYDDNEGYQCSECEESYRDKLQMIIHMSFHLKSKIPSENSNSLIIKADSSLFAPYSCRFCDQRFINKKYRNSHLRKNHRNDILECEVCQKLFLCKETLKKHCKEHMIETKYSCEYCYKYFTSKWFLKRHARKFCANKSHRSGVEECDRTMQSSSKMVSDVSVKEEMPTQEVMLYDESELDFKSKRENHLGSNDEMLTEESYVQVNQEDMESVSEERNAENNDIMFENCDSDPEMGSQEGVTIT